MGYIHLDHDIRIQLVQSDPHPPDVRCAEARLLTYGEVNARGTVLPRPHYVGGAIGGRVVANKNVQLVRRSNALVEQGVEQ
jgi:hypothetical protein